MTILLSILCLLAAIVLLCVITIYRLNSIVGRAALELCAILSFEEIPLQEVEMRIAKSNSRILNNYFNSLILRSVVCRDYNKTSVGQMDVPRVMLLHLLGGMEIARFVELTLEDCTMAWLEQNEFRLRALPPDERDNFLETARFCKELEDNGRLASARRYMRTLVFVRKLPMGRRPPPPREQSFKFVLQPT